jgi:NAD(P)-dependent dehydrogenase (short-subunit alcohol dehydrogenase family)
MHYMNSDQQRVVLVTGASSGIGLACATHLQRHGYTVFGANRHPHTDMPFATLLILDKELDIVRQLPEPETGITDIIRLCQVVFEGGYCR